MLVTGGQLGCISTMMQGLGRRYVQYFNSRYYRTGTLWEGRFKSSLVDSEHYILRCYRYIELNPVRAQMVLCESVTEHEISKIRAHINQGKVLGSTRFQQEIEELVGRSCLFGKVPRDLAPKYSVQFLPFGRNVSWSPFFTISTSDVSNRHSAGKRTAWLRPLQNTLAVP